MLMVCLPSFSVCPGGWWGQHSAVVSSLMGDLVPSEVHQGEDQDGIQVGLLGG